MTMAYVRDTGYHGKIKSLGGLNGAEGMGLIVGYDSVAIATSTNVQVLQANPCRKWAIMHNINNSDITVFFGDTAAAGVAGVRLPRLGSLLIDEFMPWTGAMTAFQDSGSTINLFIEEASVQP